MNHIDEPGLSGFPSSCKKSTPDDVVTLVAVVPESFEKKLSWWLAAFVLEVLDEVLDPT